MVNLEIDPVDHVPNNNDPTVDPTGEILEELKEKASKMTEAAAIRAFYAKLVGSKTGTQSVESI